MNWSAKTHKQCFSLVCAWLAATGALAPPSAPAADAQRPPEVGEQARRFAGWLNIDGAKEGVLLLAGNGGQSRYYAIQFTLVGLGVSSASESSNDALQAWLLTTNGGALSLEHGGNSVWMNKVPYAGFVFKNTAPMDALFAVVIKTGGTLQLLRIPVLIKGLSRDAQYQWDTLMSFPPQELDAFQRGKLRGKKNAFDRAIIERTMHELRALGVTVQWDRKGGEYVIKH
jgi:hypothetical protein